MTRLAGSELARERRKMQEGNLEFSLTDGMSASVEQTIRALPTAAVARGIDNMFDQTAPMDYQKANLDFGLEGEAAFTEEDEVTEDMAKDRANDMHAVNRTEIIQNMVNEDSPITGRITQFAASMAAGFTDPALMGINVGVNVLMAKGIGAIAKSATVTNAVIRSNPTAGRVLVEALEAGMNGSFMQIAAREGTENFVASILEETVNFAGVGEERLSRPVTLEESLTNILVGTALGTVAGTLVSKDGRKSIGRYFGKKYGDDAAEFAQLQARLHQFESEMGMENSNLASIMADKEEFQFRPWHDQEAEYVYKPDIDQTKLYLPINEDGSVKNISQRGAGYVVTDNKVQAMNKGHSVKTVNASDLNLLDDSKFKGAGSTTKRVKARVINNTVDQFVKHVDADQLAKTLAVIEDPNVDLSGVVGGKNKTKGKAILKQKLKEIETLDDMLDFMHQVSGLAGTDFNMHTVIDQVLKDNGFDGYKYTGFTKLGDAGHNGVYIHPEAGKKVKHVADEVTPLPDPTNKVKWELENERLAKWYANKADGAADSLKKAETENAIGKPEDTPTTVETPQDVPAQQILLAGKNKREYMQAEADKLRASLETRGELTPEEAKQLAVLDNVLNNKSMDKVTDEALTATLAFTECMASGAKVSVDPTKGNSIGI